MNNEELEQTLVLIKPDALKNSLTGYLLSQLSEFHTGLRFAGVKIVHVGRMLAEEHYAEHRGKVFYPSLIEYITGELHYPDDPSKRRVIAIVYQGEGSILKIRGIAGPTNPHQAREEKPGTIRALGTVVPIHDETGKVVGERMDNLIHASANTTDAEREIKLWFRPDDIPRGCGFIRQSSARSIIISKAVNFIPLPKRIVSVWWRPGMLSGKRISRRCGYYIEGCGHPVPWKRWRRSI